jgi:hypothetical protein
MTKSYSGFHGNNQGFITLASASENEALSRLYSNLRAARSQMNGAQFFGELRETIRMIRKPGTALIRGFQRYADDFNRYIKRHPEYLRAKGRRHLVDVSSGLWLEAQYGWRPLISEVKDIAETAARIALNNERRMTRVYGRSKASGALPMDQYGGPLQGVTDTAPIVSLQICQRYYSTESKAQYIAFMSSTMSGPTNDFQRVAQVSGLTLENIVPTIYELTPWSFLLDYASNLGKCIEAEFTDVSNVLYGVKTVVTKDKTRVNTIYRRSDTVGQVASYGWNLLSATGNGGYTEEIRTRMTREVLLKLPTPTLEFTLTNSGTKIGNMLALLTSSLRK